VFFRACLRSSLASLPLPSCTIVHFGSRRLARELLKHALTWLLTTAYAAVYAWLGIRRYRTYNAGVDDGIFTQSIVSAFHGFHNTLEQGHFTYHFSPILYPLAPLLWITRSTIALIVVQAAACALTIPAIHLIARKRMPEVPSLLVAAVTTLYPALGGVTFTDFHEDAFAPAGIAWLLWAIDARKLVPAVFFGLAALCIKEDVLITIAFLGILGTSYFSRVRERRWSFFCAGLSIEAVAVFIVFIACVRPLVGAQRAYPSIHDFYDAFLSPAYWSQSIVAAKFGYLFSIFFPLLGICLLSRTMLLAMPGLIECLTSKIPYTYMLGTHYPAIWIPYVMVAFASGTAKLHALQSRMTAYALIACIGINAYITIFASPNAWWYYLRPRTTHHALLDKIIAELPASADVAANYEIYAHLGFNPNASITLNANTTHVLIDDQLESHAWSMQAHAFVTQSDRYHEVKNEDGIHLYVLDHPAYGRTSPTHAPHGIII
jgi:uncharacterized membrane protein